MFSLPSPLAEAALYAQKLDEAAHEALQAGNHQLHRSRRAAPRAFTARELRFHKGRL